MAERKRAPKWLYVALVVMILVAGGAKVYNMKSTPQQIPSDVDTEVVEEVVVEETE